MFEGRLLLEEFQGLRPRAWICVGKGYSREDIKALLLSKGISFTGDTVLTPQGLAQKILTVSPEAVLGSPARQEVLRLLLSQPGIRERFPELRRLKRQGSFWRRLDLAIQSGRMAFAHWEEAEVYSERLALKHGPNSVRAEVESLARGYETWLQQNSLWDGPLLLREAGERLASFHAADAKDPFELPEKIYLLQTQTPESLERSFWEAVQNRVACVKLSAADFTPVSRPAFSWQRWHTLDDAAEELAQELAGRVTQGQSISDTVVLITDVPSSRRALKRALEQSGVALSDPRDPTRLRWDEMIKAALLPLEASARGFERTRVIPYLQRFVEAPLSKKSEWILEIQNRGIRNGLRSYSGGKLANLHKELVGLESALGGKRTPSELGQAHLQFLQSRLNGRPEFVAIFEFFEGIWKQMVHDLDRVGLAKRRAATLYWLERLQSRVAEAPAPVEKLKPRGGLDVYRLHQAPARSYRKIHVFGLPAAWFSGEGTGDYWFSERERETLSSEFAVRSGIQIRQERAEALRAWFSQASEVVFLDALYDPDGRERESLRAAIEEIERWGSPEGGYDCPEEPQERGSHERWLPSYGALRPMSPQQATLEPVSSPATISASTLENYSRCGFLALVRNRWKLADLSEPDTDLWPQIKGIVLHEAVRLLVASRDSQGNFARGIEEVIEEAWKSKRPKGLLQGARIEAYAKRKLAVLLGVFVEQERKYVQRAGTRVLSLEDLELKMDFGGFSILGEPDRIDEHPEGIFIIDYKTSSSAPSGTAMLENGYRLQLPFYALAAEQKLRKPALGLQFVQLDRKGTRSSGVFFKPLNGKEPGKLTQTTGNSKSLLSLPREEVWGRFRDQIEALGAGFVSGQFEARPRISPRTKECDSCQVSDFCGYRRLLQDGEEGGAGE